MQGCFASRYTHVEGNMFDQLDAVAPLETEWILNFKHNHYYEVQNGWKMWVSAGSRYVEASDIGQPFKIQIECADCEEVEIPTPSDIPVPSTPESVP